MIVGLLGANGQLGQEIQDVHNMNDLPCTLRLFTRENFNTHAFYANTPLKECDYIINTIAYHKPVDDLEDNIEEAISTNTRFPIELAKFCKQYNIGLVHISSDYVYDGEIEFSHIEKHTRPQNMYGLTKLWGEQGISHFHERAFILRVASLFGQKGTNFPDSICNAFTKNGEVTLPNDQFMSPTSCDTLAKIIFVLMSADERFGVYNCCNDGDPVSWYEYTREIFRLRNLPIEKVFWKSYADNITKAVRPQYSAMSNEKLHKLFPMLVIPTWKEALTDYINKKDKK